MKIKTSIIIPYMESDPGKPAVLKRLTDSLIGYDEIIISSNWKEGYAKPINRGLRSAHGDFFVVMNDDLVLGKGEVRDLCVPGVVTSPTVDGKEQPFWGCCFCIPREIYEKVGGLWEGYRISYFDDDDYINILRQNKVPMKCVNTVNFENVDGGGRTLHTFPDHKEFFQENKLKFIERWGGLPDQVSEFYNLWKRLPEKGVDEL